MKVLALISQKGGVGKTTLATALAVAAVRDGKSAAVFDLDPQASASFWRDTREAEDPAVVAVPASRLSHGLRAAKESGCAIAIIDAPPFAKDVAFEAAQVADYVLIPTRPAVLDLMASTKTMELIKQHNAPSAVVLTFVPPQGGREVADTEAAVAQLGADLCPIRIYQRIAYQRAQQTGQTAQELGGDNKAADEIQGLYEYVCMHLYGDTKHG